MNHQHDTGFIAVTLDLYKPAELPTNKTTKTFYSLSNFSLLNFHVTFALLRYAPRNYPKKSKTSAS